MRIGSSAWQEEKSIQVSTEEPVTVHFHRDWIGHRTIQAQPTLGGQKFKPSASAVALAWTDRTRLSDKIHTPIITDAGIVEVAFDEEHIALLLLDREQHLSAFGRAGPDDSGIELAMQPNAAYSGRLVDRHDDSPLTDRTVKMITEGSFLDVVEAQQTDDDGEISFGNLPSGVPLRLSIENQRDEPDYFLFDSGRQFEPGESRTNDLAEATLMDGNTAVRRDRPRLTIAERLTSSGLNAQAMGMRVIVVIEGDDSRQVKYVSGRLQNYREVEAIARFLPVSLSSEEVVEQADYLAQTTWDLPKAGEVGLYVLSTEQELVASLRLNCSSVESVVQQGTQFIEQNAPELADGRKKLRDAKAEAESSGRSVWVIAGGTRCGPCFRLARWISKHHEALETDLVIVKLTAEIDQHANDIREEIGGEGHGIPFHAMLSPEGEILKPAKVRSAMSECQVLSKESDTFDRCWKKQSKR